MRRLSAREAEYGFGRLTDLARAAPVVVVIAIEEFERLNALDQPAHAPANATETKEWAWRAAQPTQCHQRWHNFQMCVAQRMQRRRRHRIQLCQTQWPWP